MQPVAIELNTSAQASLPDQGRSKKTASLMYLLAGIAIIVGVVIRCCNLDYKLYQRDEFVTSLFISGYAASDTYQDIGKATTAGEFQKYQHFNTGKNTIDALRGLARCLPEQGPLYLLAARVWAHIFGDSPTSLRVLSVALGILVIPLTVLLCLELSQSAMFASMAAAIVCLSPIQLLYSQQARPYALWSFLILLSSTLLLRSLRLNKKVNWAAFCLVSTATVYAHLATCTLFLSQGLFTWFHECFRFNKRVMYFCAAAVLAVIFFGPWLKFFLFGHPMFTDSIRQHLTPAMMALKLASHAVLPFALHTNCLRGLAMHALRYFIITLAAYGMYTTWQARRQNRAFAYLLFLCAGPVFLLLRDIPAGDCLCTYDRYVVPTLLALQIMVAYALADLWNHGRIRRGIGIALFLVVLGIEFTSCLSYSRLKDYEGFGYGVDVPAKLLQRVKKPLVVGDVGILLGLSYLVDGKTRFIPVEPGTLRGLPTAGEPYYFLTDIPGDRQILQAHGLQTLQIEPGGRLFFVTPPMPGQSAESGTGKESACSH